METVRLYERRAHDWVFHADVVETFRCADDTAVILDQTGCFPGLPGHQKDRAWLNGRRVKGIVDDGEHIIHFLDAPLFVGERVTGTIDRDNRLRYMQFHTAEHLLMGVLVKCFGVRPLRWNYELDETSVDFLGSDFNESVLKTTERQVNDLIRANIEVLVYREYIQSEPPLRVPLSNPPRLGDHRRIVEVHGVDLTVCDGLHCESTGWVSSFMIDRYQKIGFDPLSGDHQWRVWFTAGDQYSH